VKPSDNTLVTLYPIGDNFYALTETACVNQIDPKNLEIIERSYLNRHLGVVIVTAHPHVLSDGSAYNVGQTIGSNGGEYNIIYFPKGEKSVEEAKVIAKVPARFKFHPAYIHSFGMTENHFIILETPFVLSIPTILKATLIDTSYVQSLMWLTGESTRIILIDRATNTLSHTFYADPFFCFHTINNYEKNNEVVFDMCCYENAGIVDAAHVEKMTKNDPENAIKILLKPLRFVLPLKSEEKNKNLVKLEGSKATAHLNEKGEVFCTPEILSEIGCEFPRINYPKYLATEYRYFYSIVMDYNENLGAIMKVDTNTKKELLWKHEDSYAWEPVFVPAPNAENEDDGVVVTAYLSTKDANRVGLIILDAKNMKELARAEFTNLPSAITKPFHGWFLFDE
jgi:carotenoid isomerooxygenase